MAAVKREGCRGSCLGSRISPQDVAKCSFLNIEAAWSGTKVIAFGERITRIQIQIEACQNH